MGSKTLFKIKILSKLLIQREKSLFLLPTIMRNFCKSSIKITENVA